MNFSNTYFFTATVATVIFLSAGCKKLPRETHRGRNKMACYVNGEKWVAKDKIFNSSGLSTIGSGVSNGSNPSAILYGSGNSFNISGGSKKENQGGIIINLITFSGVGEYELKMRGNSESNAKYNYFDYYTDSIHTGMINIKYFTDKVLAGTFSFEAINQIGDIIKVTDGRFDIEYSIK